MSNPASVIIAMLTRPGISKVSLSSETRSDGVHNIAAGLHQCPAPFDLGMRPTTIAGNWVRFHRRLRPRSDDQEMPGRQIADHSLQRRELHRRLATHTIGVVQESTVRDIEDQMHVSCGRRGTGPEG